MSIRMDGESLDVEKLHTIGKGEKVTIPPDAWERIASSHKRLLGLIDDGEKIYGVTTGVGRLVSVKIPPSEMESFQLNILRSHSVAVGERLDVEVVRASMALRLNSFTQGFSGISTDAVKLLLEFLNRRITPIVHSRGSLGASGDLALLAQMALPLVGEGKVLYEGKETPASDALREEGLNPIRLGPKDALALINGTSVLTAEGTFALKEALNSFDSTLTATALMFFFCASPLSQLDGRLIGVRPHRGAIAVAERLRRLILGAERCVRTEKLQDAYSLRCAPQILGAVYESFRHLEEALNTELSSVSDNPLIIEGRVLSGGNFHGAPVALPLDSAAIATYQLATLAERHIARLMEPDVTGLPPFLAKRPGAESGLMMAHYLANSLLNEVRLLSSPVTTDHAVVSLGQEDTASFGMMSALKLRRAVKLTAKIIALALLCLAEALDMARLSDSLPKPLLPKYSRIRSLSPPFKTDEDFHKAIEKISSAVLSEGI